MLRCKRSVIFLLQLHSTVSRFGSGVIMVHRVVPVVFSHDNHPSGMSPDFRVPAADTAEPAGSAWDFALHSVPVPQFTKMREQDLVIWTLARLVRAVVGSLTESLWPTAKLRPIPISKDDHA